MARGVTPRQPARTGRQEGTRKSPSGKKPVALRAPRTGGDPRLHTVRGAAAPAKAHGKAYNPTAPDRVHEILKRLNSLYPDVTCALHHKT
jgi:hypothetical protein